MSGKVYGYGRVSTEDQKLDLQEKTLKEAGAQVILMEKASGKDTTGRPKLRLLLEVIGEGDVLLVTKLDRLARSNADLYEIAGTLEAKGAQLRVLNNAAIDTTSPMGKLIFSVIGAVGEFERDLIRERQREGIEQAKRDGVYRGRPPTINAAKVHEMRQSGIGPSQIARELKCSEASVFRILNQGMAA